VQGSTRKLNQSGERERERERGGGGGGGVYSEPYTREGGGRERGGEERKEEFIDKPEIKSEDVLPTVSGSAGGGGGEGGGI
jgi:hypothetical protein